MQVNFITTEELNKWGEDLIKTISALIHPELSTSKIYSNKEAAHYLKVCSKTLQNYRVAGLIRFTQVGRKITYSQSDLDAFTSLYKQQLFSKKIVEL